MAYLASLTVSLTKLVGRIQGQSMYILIRSIQFFECINCSTKNDDNDSSGEFHCCNVLSIKPALYAGSTLNNEYIGKNSPLGTGGKKRRGRGCIGHEGGAALAACSTYLHLWPNRLARGGLDSLRVDRERPSFFPQWEQRAVRGKVKLYKKNIENRERMISLKKICREKCFIYFSLPTASRLSCVGWFSRALAICLLYQPSGKMRTTRSLVLSR